VTLQIEDRLTYLAKVNSDLLTVAVRNIVENAIMASPKGESVQIEVVQNNRHVVIAVSDHGRGIPDADLPHIADRFYRGKNAPNGGSGLGLSIVAAAVQRLTGTVEFQARPDGGEIVALRIPVSPDVNTK
jgi:two-component system sensor histidine kinase QseC